VHTTCPAERRQEHAGNRALAPFDATPGLGALGGGNGKRVRWGREQVRATRLSPQSAVPGHSLVTSLTPSPPPAPPETTHIQQQAQQQPHWQMRTQQMGQPQYQVPRQLSLSQAQPPLPALTTNASDWPSVSSSLLQGPGGGRASLAAAAAPSVSGSFQKRPTGSWHDPPGGKPEGFTKGVGDHVEGDNVGGAGIMAQSEGGGERAGANSVNVVPVRASEAAFSLGCATAEKSESTLGARQRRALHGIRALAEVPAEACLVLQECGGGQEQVPVLAEMPRAVRYKGGTVSSGRPICVPKLRSVPVGGGGVGESAVEGTRNVKSSFDAKDRGGFERGKTDPEHRTGAQGEDRAGQFFQSYGQRDAFARSPRYRHREQQLEKERILGEMFKRAQQ